MMHTGPGRRFAVGSTKEDHLLGLFGFVAHMFFFFAIAGFFVKYSSNLASGVFIIFNSIMAVVCLVVRAMQVGSTTTKESIQAIKEVWTK